MGDGRRQQLALLLLAGCGRIGFAVQTGDAVGGGDAVSAVGGSGTISGTGCNGASFTSIAAAYVFGNQEFPGLPDLVLLEQPLPCAEFCHASWDDTAEPCQAQQGLGTVPTNMQFVRLIFGGSAAGSYAAGGFMPPVGAQARATAYVTSTPAGTAAQCDATSGTVSLAMGGDMVPLSGSFTFSDGGATTVMGSFSAAWCPSGWYP